MVLLDPEIEYLVVYNQPMQLDLYQFGPFHPPHRNLLKPPKIRTCES